MSSHHQARKRFGQNFLQDSHVISRIVNAINPQIDEHLVEIGPGLGAITRELINRCMRLDAVELDRDLVKRLQGQFDQPHFQLHSADALKFDFCSLQKDQPLKIVGNLPYNISTPLIFHILENRECIKGMYFMLQKEVVDRLCASPGSKAYGRLSVLTQTVCETQNLFDIPPEAFDPVPKVMSAFVQLTPLPLPRVCPTDWPDFTRVVTAAFTHKRKTLRNNLKKSIDTGAAAQIIDLSRRAETLSIDEFLALSKCLLTE